MYEFWLWKSTLKCIGAAFEAVWIEGPDREFHLLAELQVICFEMLDEECSSRRCHMIVVQQF